MASNDLNQCNFIGRLGKDPETRYLASGDAVTSFTIAVGWKSRDKEGAEWVTVTTFGKLAEIVSEYCAKGKQVFVSGRMKTDKYDKDGQTHYSTKIVADKVQLLGGGEGRQQSNQSDNGHQYGAGVNPNTSGGDFDSDIPFLQHDRFTVC